MSQSFVKHWVSNTQLEIPALICSEEQNKAEETMLKMKLVQKVLFILLASTLALGQTPAANNDSAGSVADELKALREAIAEQQKQIAQQQKQIAQQQEHIQTLEQRVAGTPGAPHVADAALHTATPTTATNTVQETEKPKESPLSFRIGGTDFTPGGFVDFENIFRSTNTTNVTGTNYGQIPFSNTVQGHLTEFRATGQYSRYNLKVSGKYGANNVVGYLEGDFNGNDAANVFVSANGHTNRLRLYWVDLKRGKWEFLGGQTWGLQTPNRKGLSPNPADVFVTIGEDANVHVGVNYTRAAAFRAVLHANDNFAWGVEVQNPQQYVGIGEVVFPFLFNAQLGPQFDAANNAGAPNVAPDIITKFSWDAGSGRGVHFEAGALMTTAKDAVIGLTPNFVTNSKIGGGVMGGINVEVAKGFRVLGYGMWGNGVGRYLFGLAPNAVVTPTGDISMVHSGDVIIGSEIQAGKNSQFGFYYGGMYAQRNFFLDPTNPVPGRFAGFGAPNSPNTANRTVQEGTIDWTQTFWKNPQYGALLLVTQASYVTRAPWFVAPGAPKNAHLGMGYLSLRYVLP
jgi:cell division protein FtsB